jgi:heme-degrading monooxygenase HmoA
MSSSSFAETPAPPYYAVIFTSRHTDMDNGYSKMADRMAALASQQPGYLGAESVRGADGVGITVSYWKDEESIRHWRENVEHKVAQESGKRIWYQNYIVRVSKVERAYGK